MYVHIVCDIIPCMYFATEMCDWGDEETYAPLVQMATCNPCAFYRLSMRELDGVPDMQPRSISGLTFTVM